jgi:hypothetical protein
MSDATGRFTVRNWDENTYSELGQNSKLTKVTVTFAFDGDLAGEATWDAVMYYRPDGTAVFTGFQQMTGTLDGHDGSFVVQADGEFVSGEARTRWQVVDGSGTGALAGLTGSGEAVATATPPGTYTLDYSLA